MNARILPVADLEKLLQSNNREQWKQGLLLAGLWDLQGSGPAARHLERLRAAVLPDPAYEQRERRKKIGKLVLLWGAAIALFLFLTWLEQGGMFCLGGLVVFPGLAIGRVEEQPFEADPARKALKELLALDFLEAFPGILLENRPRLREFQKRVQLLEQAAQQQQAQQATAQQTLERIRQLNLQLHRPEEDEETVILQQQIGRLQQAGNSIHAMLGEWKQKEAQLQRSLEGIRLQAQRLALSEQVEMLRESELPPWESTEMDQQLQDLQKQLQDQQLQLAAMQEIQSIRRL